MNIYIMAVKQSISSVHLCSTVLLLTLLLGAEGV